MKYYLLLTVLLEKLLLLETLRLFLYVHFSGNDELAKKCTHNPLPVTLAHLISFFPTRKEAKVVVLVC